MSSTPGRQRVGVDGEVVVLAGDLDAPVRQVLDRVVGAVVAERQLDRVGAQRPAEQLVTEADAEDGTSSEQPGDRVDRVGHLGRVAGTVGQEDAVGLVGPARPPPVVDAGTTSTVPSSARWRRIVRLMPKS